MIYGQSKLPPRVISRMDIKGTNLVKGVHLEGLRVIGTPQNLATWYCLQGADELLYIDLVASLYRRSNLIDVVRATAGTVDIPLTVGGGIRSTDDCRDLLRAGADKLAINSAAVEDRELLAASVRRFGSSTIVSSIEAKKTGIGWEVLTKSGRERTGLEVHKWAQFCIDSGVGELLITSIDADGTGRGYDLELVRSLASFSPIPVIASGGAGTPADVVAVLTEARADAVAVASMFHYHESALSVGGGLASGEGNTTFLSAGRRFGVIDGCTVREVKDAISQAGFAVRERVEAA